MDSIDDQKTKFNEKVLEAQAKRGEIAECWQVDRLKQLENPSEARSLSDYNLMRFVCHTYHIRFLFILLSKSI